MDRSEALQEILDALIAKMDTLDAKRMRATVAESADEDSEQPISPGNIDPMHSEAEDQGGHAGELAAQDVDVAEAGEKKSKESEELRKKLR